MSLERDKNCRSYLFCLYYYLSHLNKPYIHFNLANLI
nr:MAG TPA: hypothetical protein [Caudoviricetes sp.]